MTVLWAVGGAVGGLASGVALRELVNRFTRTGIALPLVSAAVLAVLAIKFAGSVEVLAFACLGAVGVALAFIDTAVRRLPDVLTLPAYPAVLILLTVAALTGGTIGALGRAVLGGLTLAFVYRVLEFVNPAGMGYGDVKLSGVIGMALAWLGWPVLLLGAALAFILSAVVSLVLLLLRKVTLKSTLPFGPFMLLGAFAAVLLS
ncbi:prepilin peptidase [Lentzea aerocolonigenes]|uniref:prepilin peptidase n=1 Tax=Lentzea aerocolonigenes TaxID=68170 RepID=UPI0004C34F2F|nr:A24 family peptidase [Lentzea aerocolonigenes]MCP2250979.1 leader peptidase (prepilin peptidase) / N-methyltransferase [Lentzea aerocolonigenes]